MKHTTKLLALLLTFALFTSPALAASDKPVIYGYREGLAQALKEICDGCQAELILTTGGTGFSTRDNAPEATMDVVERPTPGISEAMRLNSMKITPRAMLSRAAAGIRRQALIVNLPGSPKAVRENLEDILPTLDHGLGILTGREGECARK